MINDKNQAVMDQDCIVTEVAEIEVQQDIYQNCCSHVQFD